MISVTRINGEPVTINADLIEFIESTPDTLISLTTGRKIMVCESVDEVKDRIFAYEAAIHAAGRHRRAAAAPDDAASHAGRA
jgi:flagellar protein FlbD